MLGFKCSFCNKKVIHYGPPLSPKLPSLRQCQNCNGPLSDVFKLPCNHLVHTICFAYCVSQADEIICPICREIVTDPEIKNVFQLYAYDIILTKLFKFSTTATFEAADSQLKLFFLNELNLLLGTNTFMGDAEEGQWPDFQAHTFVKYFLKSAKEDPDLMKQLAEFAVLQHCCNNQCQKDCKDKEAVESSSSEAKIYRINEMLGKLQSLKDKEHLVKDFKELGNCQEMGAASKSFIDVKQEINVKDEEEEMEKTLWVNLKGGIPTFSEADWESD